MDAGIETSTAHDCTETSTWRRRDEAVCCRSSISDAKNLEEAAAIPCREKLLLPSVFVHLLGSLIGYHR